MHYLFTYGTLQDRSIQLQVFERLLNGFTDGLMGFRISEEKIFGRYPVIEPTENKNQQVNGTVYELIDEELAKADQYEGSAYKKIKVDLISGVSAWVYVKA
ncbi:gamma-glutamylcyclotransferase family protein [Zobellia alginiliquefaciens]|uniref:gamma-glutamylcyclotransferase family protein n=1 Tax=Zobellia alginiliquefaciens TaxID=3032586 RepID=UPI0023E364D0|nr:gamma-glutamylcyclotransferase family protein [Zobellia alginiliquefaciens]